MGGGVYEVAGEGVQEIGGATPEHGQECAQAVLALVAVEGPHIDQRHLERDVWSFHGMLVISLDVWSFYKMFLVITIARYLAISLDVWSFH